MRCCFMVAAAFGAVYEIYEWTSDSLGSTNYQPNNDDTMTVTTANLVGGLVGGVVVMAWVSSIKRRGRASTSAREPTRVGA